MTNITIEGLWSHAYKLCASIRALQASNDLCAEYGARDRLLGLLESHAYALKATIPEVWTKYDKLLIDRHRYRVEEQIEAGQFDEAVVKRTARLALVSKPIASGIVNRPANERSTLMLDQFVEPGRYDVYPQGSVAPAPAKPSHIKVALEDGRITAIHFDINVGLPDGSYSLHRNPA